MMTTKSDRKWLGSARATKLAVTLFGGTLLVKDQVAAEVANASFSFGGEYVRTTTTKRRKRKLSGGFVLAVKLAATKKKTVWLCHHTQTQKHRGQDFEAEVSRKAADAASAYYCVVREFVECAE